MRVLWHECKKIMNLRLVLAAVLFTLFFYNIFVGAWKYPSNNADSAAELQISQRLMKEAGTTLPLSKFHLLEQIRDENMRKLDRLVAENKVLKKVGITTYEQAREARMELEDTGKKKEADEIYIIMSRTGHKESFMVEHINYIFEESFGNTFFLGLTEKEAAESARENYQKRFGNYSEAFYKRIEKMYTMEEMSLLPGSAMRLVKDDFVHLGILIMICCVIIILPNQIREKISKVRGLQCSTYCGRKIWTVQLLATLLVSVMICLVQMGIYFAILWKSGILDFVKCPANGCRDNYIWFDINWGTYLSLYSILIVIYVVAVMAIFHLISQLASNYVTGVAFAVVPVIVFSVLCSIGLKDFLYMNETQLTIYMPIGITAGVVLAAAGLNIAVGRWNHRRDILE